MQTSTSTILPNLFSSNVTGQQQTSVPRAVAQLGTTINALYQGDVYGANAFAQWQAPACQVEAPYQPSWTSLAPSSGAYSHLPNNDMTTDFDMGQSQWNGYTHPALPSAYTPPPSTPVSMAFAEGAFPSSSESQYSHSCSAEVNYSRGYDSNQPSAFSNTTTTTHISSPSPSPSCTSSSGTYDAAFDFDGDESIPVAVDHNSEFGIELMKLDIFGLTIGIKPILNFIDYSFLGQQQGQADTNTRLLSQSTVGVASQPPLGSPAMANSASYPHRSLSSAPISLPSVPPIMSSQGIDNEPHALIHPISTPESRYTLPPLIDLSVPIQRYTQRDLQPLTEVTTAYRDRIGEIKIKKKLHIPGERDACKNVRFDRKVEEGQIANSSSSRAVEPTPPITTRKRKTRGNDGQSRPIRWTPQHPSSPSTSESSGISSLPSSSPWRDASPATPPTSPDDSPMSDPSAPTSFPSPLPPSLGDEYLPVPSYYPKPIQYARTYRRKDGRPGNPRGTVIVNEDRLGPLSRDMHQSAVAKYSNRKRKPSEELKDEKPKKKRRGN